MALGHEVHRLQMAERGRPNLAAIGLVGAVADQIDAEFALRAFGRDIDFAGGHVEALGVELEMMDQRFHRLLHLGALRRDDLAVTGRHRPIGHLVQTLAHDLRALADFLDPHHEPVIAVAAGADRNVKLHPVIDIIRLRLAQVPGNTAAAQHRAGKAPAHRVILGHGGDIDIALLEDAVVDHQAHRILEQGREFVEPVGDIGEQLQRHVLVHAAGPEPGAVHAGTAGPLEKFQALLANLEHPDIRRHRADIHDMRTEVEHMVADPGQLGEQHTQILAAQRYLEIEQLLDRQHIAIFHRQRRAIIEPVEIGKRLQIGLVLDQFLGAAMQQTDMGIDPFDDLAIQLHHHPQDAVRRRMLGAEVDREILDFEITNRGIGLVSQMVHFVEIVRHAVPPN